MKRFLSILTTAIAVMLVALSGCDAPVERYPANELHALVVSTSRNTPTELAAEETTALTEAWFGTPQAPIWPREQLASDAAKKLVDPDQITRAAGPVYSDKQDQHFGLYREHCVSCHGVSGGGNGPASLLQNPYPRDFRAGIYKWKSTQRAAKPTRSDLMAVLHRGAPGSGMPSFLNIADEDLVALVDYVIFLSVRGEFERRMIDAAIDELGYEDTVAERQTSLLTLASGDDSIATDAAEIARETLNEICQSWLDATKSEVQVPSQSENDSVSIGRGKELFHGQIANCAGCHGKEGGGGVETLDFDDWTKEFTTRLAITPTDRDAVKPFRRAGALRPRKANPRRLVGGVFRGGGSPEELYRRIAVGIAGTPMPGVIVVDEPSPTGLTPDQIWDLVHYVLSLSDSEG